MPGFRLTAPRPHILEKHVAQQIKQSLLRRGWIPIRQQSGKFRTPDGRWITMGEPGIGDYICMHAEHPAFFLETKRPKQHMSPEQKLKQWEWNVYGIKTCKADSVEELLAFLEVHETQKKV